MQNIIKYSSYIVVMFFLACFLTGCSSEQKIQAISKDLDDLKKSIKEISELLRNLKNNMDLLELEQKAVKVMVPQEFLKEISEIFVNLKDIEKRPKSKDEIEKERKKLQSIFSRLHPLAAPLVIADISKANLILEVLFALDQYKNIPEESLDEAENLLDSLFERYVFEDFSDVKNNLEVLLKNVREKNSIHTKNQILIKAKLAYEKGQDLETAYANLEKYQDEYEKANLVDATNEIKKLRQKIHVKVLENSLKDQVVKMIKQYEKTLLIMDSKIQINSLANIIENLAKIQVDLETEEDWGDIPIEQKSKVKELNSKCEKLISDLTVKKEKEKEEEYLKKMKNYQDWALMQIDLFDGPQGWNYSNTISWVNSELAGFKDPKEKSEFLIAFDISPDLLDFIGKTLNIDFSETKKNWESSGKWFISSEKRKEIFNLGYTTAIGWRGLNTEITYRLHRDAMVKFLLPIQANLLEPPIYDRFIKAYEKGQKALESRDEDRLYLAKQALKVQKKSLNDF